MRTYCFSFVMILTVWLVEWTATMASPGHYLLQIMMFCVASSMQICIDDGITRLQKERDSDDGSNIDIHDRVIVMPFSSSFGTWASLVAVVVGLVRVRWSNCACDRSNCACSLLL